jgi:hypothetical protein
MCEDGAGAGVSCPCESPCSQEAAAALLLLKLPRCSSLQFSLPSMLAAVLPRARGRACPAHGSDGAGVYLDREDCSGLLFLGVVVLGLGDGLDGKVRGVSVGWGGASLPSVP